MSAFNLHTAVFFQPTTVIVPHAHWEAYGRGSLPLHNLVLDSANPHYVSDPLPQPLGLGGTWTLKARRAPMANSQAAIVWLFLGWLKPKSMLHLGHGQFFDYEVGNHDGAYKGSLYSAVRYIGWKRVKLGDKTEAQQEYNVIQRWHGGFHAVQKLGLWAIGPHGLWYPVEPCEAPFHLWRERHLIKHFCFCNQVIAHWPCKKNGPHWRCLHDTLAMVWNVQDHRSGMFRTILLNTICKGALFHLKMDHRMTPERERRHTEHHL